VFKKIPICLIVLSSSREREREREKTGHHFLTSSAFSVTSHDSLCKGKLTDQLLLFFPIELASVTPTRSNECSSIGSTEMRTVVVVRC
jgi:hypothetical protein